MSSGTAGARVERVVRGVCAGAVRDSGAAGVVVLEDWTPEGELACEWLVRELGEARVWRAASLASNVQGRTTPALEAALLREALVAHPANRTALLLGGRIAFADLFPLGDLWASEVEALTGRWSAPPDVEALAGSAGGAAALDAAVRALLGPGTDAGPPLPGMSPEAAGELRRLYGRGRWWRLRPRVVPKLGNRTLGIDLFD
jgi:hypothetical protein